MKTMQMQTDDSGLDLWYSVLVFGALFNGAFYLRTVTRKASSTSSSYAKIMLLLAFPMVLECCWRSLLPALYLQRFVWWDSPLSGILLERCLACAGELAWNAQLALFVLRVDRTQSAGGQLFVRLCSLALMGTYTLAECVSFYNTATTNEWWAAAEEALDALSQLLLLPAVLLLLWREWSDNPSTTSQADQDGKVFDRDRRARHSSSKTKWLLSILAVFLTVYPLYNFTVDVPMYLARYRADQRRGKRYFTFGEGLVDAGTRRVPTRRAEDWDGDVTWMLLYFVLNPFAATSLAALAE